jgi:cytochrome c553
MGMGLLHGNPRQAFIACLVVVLALLRLTSVNAAESVEKRFETCAACHGANGQSQMPDIPSLGAQTAPYALIQLYMFRGGLRTFPPMNEAVKDFTDDDLRTFSDHIAKLPAPKPPAEPSDAERMARGKTYISRFKCDFCHNADLAGRENVPRIAGQREDFLLKTLREYKANTRSGYDASMADVLARISDEELADLAYYSARQP